MLNVWWISPPWDIFHLEKPPMIDISSAGWLGRHISGPLKVPVNRWRRNRDGEDSTPSARFRLTNPLNERWRSSVEKSSFSLRKVDGTLFLWTQSHLEANEWATPWRRVLESSLYLWTLCIRTGRRYADQLIMLRIISVGFFFAYFYMLSDLRSNLKIFLDSRLFMKINFNWFVTLKKKKNSRHYVTAYANDMQIRGHSPAWSADWRWRWTPRLQRTTWMPRDCCSTFPPPRSIPPWPCCHKETKSFIIRNRPLENATLCGHYVTRAKQKMFINHERFFFMSEWGLLSTEFCPCKFASSH